MRTSYPSSNAITMTAVGFLFSYLFAAGAQVHAQQSFGFSFSSSSSFSSSDQPPSQPVSPGEESSSPYPSSTGNGFQNGMSKSYTNVNGHIVEKSLDQRDGKKVSTTRILNGKQDVLIEESEDAGIQVTVKETVRGKERKSQFKADSRKALRKKHPAAFEWVRKYASDANNINFGIGAGPFGGGQANAGGFAHGNAGGFARGAAGANAGGGAFNGPEAQELMKKQIQQMIQQSDNPAVKQQLQTMLEQIQNIPVGPNP